MNGYWEQVKEYKEQLLELEGKKQEISRKLEELHESMGDKGWSIYIKSPTFNEVYFFVDNNRNDDIIDYVWCDDSGDVGLINNSVILHKTKESAELEFAFREALQKRRKAFEYLGENYCLVYNMCHDFLYAISDCVALATEYWFTKEDAEWLIDNFPKEVILAVMFNLRG